MDLAKVEMLNDKLIEYCMEKIEVGFRSGRLNDDYIKVLNKVLENAKLTEELKMHKGYKHNHENKKQSESHSEHKEHKHHNDHKKYGNHQCSNYELDEDATDFEELIHDMACIGSEEQMWKIVRIVGEYLQEVKAFNRSKFDHIMNKIKEVK